MIEGRCHCNRLSWRTASRPQWLNVCTCSFCHRAGALWGEVEGKDTTIRHDGEVSEYVHGEATLAFVFCPVCGNLSHWRSVGAPGRMKLNFRLADPALIEAFKIRTFDGARSWTYLDDA